MDELQSLRRIRSLYGSILISAAAQFGHRPEILAGIMQRETEGGTSKYLDKPGPAGRGDSLHGHGLMQIDDRSFREFCDSADWKDPAKNVAFGARVLAQKRAYLASHLLGFAIDNGAMERATIAAYNCGEGNVCKAIRAGEDVDSRTANHNYSREVLRLAEVYTEIMQEEVWP